MLWIRIIILVTWIRIILVTLVSIRIRIKIYKLDPEPDLDPHQFEDVKLKYTEYEPI